MAVPAATRSSEAEPLVSASAVRLCASKEWCSPGPPVSCSGPLPRSGRQRGALRRDELGVRAGGAAHRLGGVVDQHVQRPPGRHPVRQRDHLCRVAQVESDHREPVQPVRAVRHRGEAAHRVVREAGGDGRLGAVAQQAERDVHADLGPAAGEQRPPPRQVRTRLSLGVVQLGARAAQLVVEGVHLDVALLADVAGPRIEQRAGDLPRAGLADGTAAGLVVDPAGSGRGGGRRHGEVVGQHLVALLPPPADLDALVDPRRRLPDPHRVGVVGGQVVELGQHVQAGLQPVGVDAGHGDDSRRARRQRALTRPAGSGPARAPASSRASPRAA
jgi:hypothetical protein